MSRALPIIVIFGISLTLWSGAIFAGQYLEQGLFRREVAKSPNGKIITVLREEVEADPSDASKRIALAEAYISEGYRLQNGQLLMRGLEQYKATLDVSPEHPQALLGLARVSLQSGVIDRAVEFFYRFLATQPDDKEARNDLVVALAQLNRTDEAFAELKKIEELDGDFFPAKLSLALIYRIKGETQAAEEALQAAATIAPSEEVSSQIMQALAQLRGELSSERPVSPAGAVTAYFKDHQIIGPKIARFEWQSENRVTIFLNDFPIEQMPPAMRELFISRAAEKLKGIGTAIQVELKDAKNTELLLALSVGTSLTNSKTSNSSSIP